MKKIVFIRHYKLELPYNNWKNLNLLQYSDLSSGKVDPDIYEDCGEFLLENFEHKYFSNFDTIYTSSFCSKY